jgi:protein-S-isoprenylcysteine O-methyltransferase Ste14
MLRNLLRTLFLVLIIIVAPVFGKPHLLMTWQVATALIAGTLLNLTQPPVTEKDLTSKTEADRWSVTVVMVAAMCVFVVPILDFAYGTQKFAVPWSGLSITGIALTFGGLVFRYWSIRTLGKWFTSVVRVQEGQVVIQHGPYRYLRHPSYLGAFILAIGISIIFRSYIGLGACFLIFFPAYVYRIHVEEKALLEKLGAAYREYQKRTYKMFPLIY